MGCPHNKVETTEEPTEEDGSSGGTGGLWALVIVMLIINLALMVLMCSLMNHVKFHVSTIWADLKQKLNMGGDENTRSGNSKYEPPQQVEQPKMTPVQLPQNPVKKPSSYRLPQKK